jgi:hypothetical protein
MTELSNRFNRLHYYPVQPRCFNAAPSNYSEIADPECSLPSATSSHFQLKTAIYTNTSVNMTSRKSSHYSLRVTHRLFKSDNAIKDLCCLLIFTLGKETSS